MDRNDVIAMVEIMKKRERIVKDYCLKKGWSPDPKDLSIDQIMEIRSQPDWISASNIPGIN